MSTSILNLEFSKLWPNDKYFSTGMSLLSNIFQVDLVFQIKSGI